jgi:LysM repeat protein
MFATAGGPGGTADSPTTVADAPYPSQHLSATDANRLSRSSGGGGGGSGDDDGQPSGSKRWIWIVLFVAIALGLVAWRGLSGKEAAKAPAPAPVQAVAPAPEPPPPPPPPPAPRQLTVAKGDCLWRLSSTHLGDPHAWRRLLEANRGKIQNPDLIFPGQVIELP